MAEERIRDGPGLAQGIVICEAAAAAAVPAVKVGAEKKEQLPDGNTIKYG